MGWFEGEVKIGDDGWADFSCHSQSMSVWIYKDVAAATEGFTA